MFVLSESSKTCYFRTVFTLLLSNYGLYEPHLLLSRTGNVYNLGKICRDSEAKNLKASLMLSTGSQISDKARCFSQSERVLYGNFIVTKYISL